MRGRGPGRGSHHLGEARALGGETVDVDGYQALLATTAYRLIDDERKPAVLAELEGEEASEDLFESLSIAEISRIVTGKHRRPQDATLELFARALGPGAP